MKLEYVVRLFFVSFFVFAFVFPSTSQTAEQLIQQSKEFSKKKEYKKAADLLLKSLQLEQKPATFYSLGLNYYYLKNWRGTVEYQGKALKAGLPDSLALFANNLTGVALLQLNRAREAVEPLRAAQRLKPADYTSRFYLAYALYKLGLYSEAIEEYKEAVRIDPTAPEAKQYLAIAETELKKSIIVSNTAPTTPQVEVNNKSSTVTVSGSEVRPDEVKVNGKDKLVAGPGGFKKGDLVIVNIYVPNEATILDFANGQYKVHYEDVDREDQWVRPEQVSAIEKGNTAGGPPAGTYICYQPIYEYSYMGSFELGLNGSYEYLTGLKGKGKYKYDAAGSSITWLSGDLAGKVIATEYTNTKQNGPMIKLIFPKGKRVGDIQTCRLKN